MRGLGVAQAPHGGEQAQRAAARGQEQFAHRSRQSVGIAPRHILDDEDARLVLVAERRAETGAARRLGQMPAPVRTSALCPVVVGVATGVAQGGRSDQRAMGGLQYLRRQRHGGIDPVPLQPDIDVAAFLAA